ncbi:MAG: CAAX protease [Synechococcales cyanobacterium T60_A2020_003]|nr:CAAX protease [Synechococcales cyanobacterium T60_A2020_003]
MFARLAVSQNPQSLMSMGLDLISWFDSVTDVVFATLTSTPVQESITVPSQTIHEVVRVSLNLMSIGVVSFLIAGLLAPLEALGWWAGWYGDEVDLGSLEQSKRQAPPGTAIARYVIYLDGVCVASGKNLPAVERFLDELEASLPNDILLLRGLMPYSVVNRPLTEDRLLAFYWRLADYLNRTQTGGWVGTLLGTMVNLRNMYVVAVSADQRYGPIYNQGIAEVMVDHLLDYGYPVESRTPITLIGYSGGGQIAVGAASFLKQALKAPIEIISLGGVISGNVNALVVDQLYHLVGDRDRVERLGTLLFPKRWPLFSLSYWNRAKRRGKVCVVPLGNVAHYGKYGLLVPDQYLPDGRSHLQQTVDMVRDILTEEFVDVRSTQDRVLSNYERFRQYPLNQPTTYPLAQSLDSTWYRPIGDWIGRLILPHLHQRSKDGRIFFEVYHAPPSYACLIGQVINLKWQNIPSVHTYRSVVVKDLHFNEEAVYSSQLGRIHPERINHWRQVDPLESLAGARPYDDMVVMLPTEVELEIESQHHAVTATDLEQGILPITSLAIAHEPIQITGRYYAVVKILRPVTDVEDGFEVVHFNRMTQQFDGVCEVVRFPPPALNDHDMAVSTTTNIERSPVNDQGWYIYGTQDDAGYFVVQALAPRSLLLVKPQQIITGRSAALHYIKRDAWDLAVEQKGQIGSTLVTFEECDRPDLLAEWTPGTRALLVHVYGGIGGEKGEPEAKNPIYFGHFAYGDAEVILDPLTGDRRFDLRYHQVYTHNPDGIISGTLHWSRYMGDRQFGWLGARPTSDILIRMDAYTHPLALEEQDYSALDIMVRQLEIMMARYRIGDGTGGAFVGPANNCAQDSNQALYTTLTSLRGAIARHHRSMEKWTTEHPTQSKQLQTLQNVRRFLQRELLPFGTARADWQTADEVLGTTLEDDPLQTLLRGLISWRTMLPRVASDTVVIAFLRQGASAWVLRTTQVGGDNPTIEPVVPLSF